MDQLKKANLALE